MTLSAVMATRGREGPDEVDERDLSEYQKFMSVDLIKIGYPSILAHCCEKKKPGWAKKLQSRSFFTNNCRFSQLSGF